MHLDFTVSLPHPIQAVYAALVDFAAIPSWQPNVKSVEVDPPGELKLGTRVKETRVFNGKTTESLGEITELTPLRSLRLESPMEAPSPGFVSDYRLFKEPGGTLLNFSVTFSLSGLQKLTAPLFERAARKDMAERLALLAEHLKTRAPAAP